MSIFIEVKLIFDKVKQCIYNISPSKLPVAQLTQLNILYKSLPYKLTPHPVNNSRAESTLSTPCKFLIGANSFSRTTS